jgi:hypothetical protein
MPAFTFHVSLPPNWTEDGQGLPEMVVPPEIGGIWSACGPERRIEVAWVSERGRFECRWWVNDAITDKKDFVYPHEVMAWLRGAFAQDKLAGQP